MAVHDRGKAAALRNQPADRAVEVLFRAGAWPLAIGRSQSHSAARELRGAEANLGAAARFNGRLASEVARFGL